MSVVDAPLTAPIWREGRPWRRKVLKRFPYVVFLAVSGSIVEIVAVAHARRRPGYWMRRPR